MTRNVHDLRVISMSHVLEGILYVLNRVFYKVSVVPLSVSGNEVHMFCSRESSYNIAKSEDRRYLNQYRSWGSNDRNNRLPDFLSHMLEHTNRAQSTVDTGAMRAKVLAVKMPP